MADGGEPLADPSTLSLPLKGPGEETPSEAGAPSLSPIPAAKEGYCHGFKPDGYRCERMAFEGTNFCKLHDPKRRPIEFRKPVKTAKDILDLIADRIAACNLTWPAGENPVAEKVICELAKTYALVHQCTNDAEAVGISSFRLKRRA